MFLVLWISVFFLNMNITEEQFNKLVTKKEFNGLETKVDKLETKVDKLETKVDKLSIEVLGTKEDVKGLKKELGEFKVEVNEKLDILISMVEANTTKDKTHEQEHTANIAAHDRFESNFALVKEKKFDEVTAMAMKS